MANLMARCQNAIPLGVIQCPKYDREDKDEFLVVYDGAPPFPTFHPLCFLNIMPQN